MRNRRSIRLREYDYSQAGAYFVTICTKDQECLFGDIENAEMQLNAAGQIISDEWLNTISSRPNMESDAFVVMPNHVHGVVVITEPALSVGAIHELPLPELPPPMTIGQRRNMTLPKIIGRFKMLSAKQINELRQTPGVPLWQRNYWEHIVRNEGELNCIREYIENNPARWEFDRYGSGTAGS